MEHDVRREKVIDMEGTFESRIMSVETHAESDGKRQWSAAATVRVFTDDAKDMGHEDPGTHTLTGPDKFKVMRTVRKPAVTDAKNRAMRIFGDASKRKTTPAAVVRR